MAADNSTNRVLQCFISWFNFLFDNAPHDFSFPNTHDFRLLEKTYQPLRDRIPRCHNAPQPAKAHAHRTAHRAFKMLHAAREIPSVKAIHCPPQYTYHDRHPASAVPLPAPLFYGARIPQAHQAEKPFTAGFTRNNHQDCHSSRPLKADITTGNQNVVINKKPTSFWDGRLTDVKLLKFLAKRKKRTGYLI